MGFRGIAGRWLVVAAFCLPQLAGAVTRVGVVTLPTATAEPVDLMYSQALVERGSVSIESAAAGLIEARLQPHEQGSPVAFAPDKELWIPLRLLNAGTAPQKVTLQVRETSLDEVLLFEPQGGRWHISRAGDRVPRTEWARPGRFARFDMQVEPGETRSLFLRVRNVHAAVVPLQVAGQASAHFDAALAEFGLSLALGALALLVLASLIQAALYRDSAYLLFGAYAALLGLALASISGIADQFLWSEAPGWGDIAKPVFPLASAGLSVWLVQTLCRIRTRSTLLARTAAAIGMLVVATAVVCAVMQVAPVPVRAATFLLAASTVVFLGVWTWQRGDPMGAWVLAAHVPLIASTALIVLRMSGVATFPFRSNALVAISIGFILVLLLVALIRRSKELLAVQMRDKGMDSIDPLTGLLSAPLFHERVRAAVLRYRRSRHDAAILYVKLANYGPIKEAHGIAVAEQSMIRAAMKLQRVFREADCSGRVGEATMGLVVETVTATPALMERASRLVAHGLMPLEGLKPEVTLVLHVAVNVLSANPLDAVTLQDTLDAELRSMASRTRRPIRFLRPPATAPVPLEPGDEKLEESSPGSIAA